MNSLDLNNFLLLQWPSIAFEVGFPNNRLLGIQMNLDFGLSLFSSPFYLIEFYFQVITRESAHVAGVGEIYDRVHVELIGKMKEMRMVNLC